MGAVIKAKQAEGMEIKWDLDEVRRLQYSHKIWGPVINQLCGGSRVTDGHRTPVPLHELRLLEDGLLYRHSTNEYGVERTQLVIPDSYIDSCLKLAHSLPFAGHGGEKVSVERLRKFAYFPGMTKHMTRFCKECEKCIRCKPSRDAPAPFQTYPDVHLPWQRVHMDLIGPFNVSESKNKYILTIIDALTRYVIGVAIPNKEATTVAKAIMNNLVSVFGTPTQLFSDHGTEFVNNVLYGLCSSLGIERRLITPYHPSANGLVERANGTIVKILKPMVEDNPSIWDTMLPMAVFAYNTGYHRTIKESPYFLLFHTDPQVPYDNIFKECRPWYDIDDYKSQMAAIANRVFNRVQEGLEEMKREIIKGQTDRAKLKEVRVGNRVYVKRIMKTGVTQKLQALYMGPYRVINKVSDVIVKLKNIKNHKELTIHTDRIKVIHEDDVSNNLSKNARRAYPIHENQVEKEITQESHMHEIMNKDEEPKWGVSGDYDEHEREDVELRSHSSRLNESDIREDEVNMTQGSD